MHTASQTQTGTLQQPSPMKLDGEAPAPDGETPHAHDEGSLSVTEAFSSDDASEKADNDTAPAVLHHAGGHHQAQHGLQQSTADVGPVDSAESATPPFPEVPEDAASFGAGGQFYFPECKSSCFSQSVHAKVETACDSREYAFKPAV